ncbi:TPA: ferredoxin [Staphylococcus pseudintermedius]|uniref:ferredoxin n=1 Tax=Staphylococcus pseudintermedius TaxID=283734 RepID=UPI0011215311|nr:ferredoxin [Staphylococcus pseudintermedius]EGQ0309425.1 ferredoxin [Staphylococcus pseudintermedius]EGQ1276398.1 ferredoxin [Staphylococcus pseudintermedius]EGQ1600461.1 ferredoxin [Staphylococcus pseudintermedius]EGQ1686573.1 ferredoxin [Staphylococcus pseudintermedius]EGQ2882180.1 ferredoxin [Staphylococcus pseudintermedius]
MSYYAYVDRDMCIACSACGAAAPRLFRYDAQGIAYMGLDCNSGTAQIPECDLGNLDDAVENCPTSAITVGQQPFSLPIILDREKEL